MLANEIKPKTKNESVYAKTIKTYALQKKYKSRNTEDHSSHVCADDVLHPIADNLMQILAIWEKRYMGCAQLKEDLNVLLDIKAFGTKVETYLKKMKNIMCPCPYTNLKEGETITVYYEGGVYVSHSTFEGYLDDTITGKFLRWEHKKDFPLGYNLLMTKEDGTVKTIDDKKIHIINKGESITEFESFECMDQVEKVICYVYHPPK